MRLRLSSALPAIALLALAVRVAYVVANRRYPVMGDALAFHLEGGFLAHGEGFRRALEDVPTAEYPPVHTVFVAAATLLGLDSFEGQKLFFCAVGTVTVVLIALLARAVTGSERVGVIAGILAALYPMLWVADGSLMAETTYGLWLVATMLAAVWLLRRPTWRRAALTGALGALAALSRGEGLFLAALLVVVVLARVPGWGTRLRLAGVAALAGAVVIAPWTIRNLSTFEDPVPISNNGNQIWVGANCDATYYGSLVGSWRFDCYGTAPPGDESQRATEYRRRGLEYLGDHLGRLPVVLAARVGRVLDVYRPWGQGTFVASAEGRHPRAHHLALLAYWLLLPFAAVGAMLLWRRREPALAVLLVPCAGVLLVAVATYGSTRFRFAAEPALVVLGAVAVDAAISSLLARRRPASATPASVSAGISQSQSMEAWKA